MRESCSEVQLHWVLLTTNSVTTSSVTTSSVTTSNWLYLIQHRIPGPPRWRLLPPLLSILAPLTWFSTLTGAPSSSISTNYLVLHIDGYSLFYQHHLPGSPHWRYSLFYQHHLPGSPHWRVLPLLPASLTWFSTLTGTPSSSISFNTASILPSYAARRNAPACKHKYTSLKLLGDPSRSNFFLLHADVDGCALYSDRKTGVPLYMWLHCHDYSMLISQVSMHNAGSVSELITMILIVNCYMTVSLLTPHPPGPANMSD